MSISSYLCKKSARGLHNLTTELGLTLHVVEMIADTNNPNLRIVYFQSFKQKETCTDTHTATANTEDFAFLHAKQLCNVAGTAMTAHPHAYP